MEYSTGNSIYCASIDVLLYHILMLGSLRRKDQRDIHCCTMYTYISYRILPNTVVKKVKKKKS